MSCQKFYANPSTKDVSPNGAVSYAPGGPMDCLGPFAKIQNCPIEGTMLRLTCYATRYADTWFSIPACTRHKGRYIGGYFSCDENGPMFKPYNRYKDRL